MKKFCFLLCVCANLCWIGVAQTSVTELKENTTCSNCVTYYLPKTELVVKVKAQQTIQKCGPFYKYAERFLGVTDVITQDKEEWQLAGVNISTRMVRDDSKLYAVSVNKKTTAYNLQTTADGVLLAVNTKLEQKTKRPEKEKPAKTAQIEFDYSQLGEEALVASSVPKMAELAAKQIYQIREDRANLLSGDNENLPDGTALKQMLKRLDESEKELVALFVGKSVTNTISKEFVVADIEDQVLCRLSVHEGLVEADNMIGEPIYLSVVPQKAEAQVSKGEKELCGLFYNVPGKAEITISDSDKVLTTKTVIVPQFGSVQFLPALLFDGKATKVEFTRYGTVKSIAE